MARSDADEPRRRPDRRAARPIATRVGQNDETSASAERRDCAGARLPNPRRPAPRPEERRGARTMKRGEEAAPAGESLCPSMRASRSRRVAAGSASGSEPSAPCSPSAVGAMSVIETSPGMPRRVGGEDPPVARRQRRRPGSAGRSTAYRPPGGPTRMCGGSALPSRPLESRISGGPPGSRSGEASFGPRRAGARRAPARARLRPGARNEEADALLGHGSGGAGRRRQTWNCCGCPSFAGRQVRIGQQRDERRQRGPCGEL